MQTARRGRTFMTGGIIRGLAQDPRIKPSAQIQEPVAQVTYIGLLGGSFNPAHEGHVHISEEAISRLALDQVWWLVSPQNPLKSNRETAPFSQRVRQAEALTKHPGIRISDFEQRRGTRYTATSLAKLTHCKHYRFIWLMGADNLRQIHLWQQWHQIFLTVPIAVFDRSPYSHSALGGKAAQYYARYRVPSEQSWKLRFFSPPAWVFLHSKRHPASSTSIRAQKT